MLREIPGLDVRENVALREHTRFGIGGAADLFATASEAEGFAAAVRCCRGSGISHYVLGDGSNVVVSEQGYRGAVLRYAGRGLARDGERITAGAGARLQALIDFAIAAGLCGVETLAGIPGSVGGAIYGNLPAAAAAEVPPEAVRDGKVASAYFQERVGAKGMRRGGIEIASYHANLIYNAGGGTADDLRALILELKQRVRERYGFEVEEEVQYVGEFE